MSTEDEAGLAAHHGRPIRSPLQDSMTIGGPSFGGTHQPRRTILEAAAAAITSLSEIPKTAEHSGRLAAESGIPCFSRRYVSNSVMFVRLRFCDPRKNQTATAAVTTAARFAIPERSSLTFDKTCSNFILHIGQVLRPAGIRRRGSVTLCMSRYSM